MTYVTVYTETFHPLAVIETSDEQLRGLRSRRGDTIRFIERMPQSLADYRSSMVPAPRDCQCTFSLQAQRWADGVARPIVVIQGQAACESLMQHQRESMWDLPQFLTELMRTASGGVTLRPRNRGGDRVPGTGCR